jgi:cell division transport system permease protein
MTRVLSFCVREAGLSLWRQRGLSLQAVCTIAVAMFVLAAFLTVAGNLDRAVSMWGAAAEITVYLRDDITEAQRADVNRMLADSPLVASRAYVSKAEARRRFERDFPDLAGSVATLEQNPLPASIDLGLRPELATTDVVEALATRLGVTEGVADVRFDRRWLDRLALMARAVSWTGWMLGAVLILAAGLTVATVVRLSLHTRRDEIEILQLMGAPMVYLRGPFVTEGMIHGAVGAMMAVIALYGAHAVVEGGLRSAIPRVVESGLTSPLPWRLAVSLVAGGTIVGCAGGLVAARRVR